MSIEYHEPPNEVSPKNRDLHRALSSLAEEIEAIDWYQQRIDASSSEELKALIKHNRNEELEHVAMLLEFIRRQIPKLDEHLQKYLFTSKPLVEHESKEQPMQPEVCSELGIGSTRGNST